MTVPLILFQVSTGNDVQQAFVTLYNDPAIRPTKCFLLFAHLEIKHSPTNDGTPKLI